FHPHPVDPWLHHQLECSPIAERPRALRTAPRKAEAGCRPPDVVFFGSDPACAFLVVGILAGRDSDLDLCALRLFARLCVAALPAGLLALSRQRLGIFGIWRL